MSQTLSRRFSNQPGGMLLVDELSPRTIERHQIITSPKCKHRRLSITAHYTSSKLSHLHPDPEEVTSSDVFSVTSPQLHDVWVNVIGPKLDAADLVVLSCVSKWGRETAQSVMHHEGYLRWNKNDGSGDCKDLSMLKSVSKRWSHLKVEMDVWEDGLQDLKDAGMEQMEPGWCKVALLRLVWCPVVNFDFVDASRLEQFHRVGPKLIMEARPSLEKMLLDSTQLNSLTLSNAIEEGDDVKWLKNALENLSQLTHLDLRCNYLEADRAEELAPALAKLTKLTTLDLSVNGFGPDGIKSLAPALANMTCMKELILQYNYMKAEGAQHLAPSLANMRQLTGLYLGENGMGPEGVRCIVEVLPSMPQLTHVNIEVKSLGEEARATVSKMLPNVKPIDLW